MLNLLPLWAVPIFLAYWVILVILLISDDREPALTVAWLFILVFIPVLGVFLYIFIGRDWKVVAQRKGWIATVLALQIENLDPIYRRNAAASARFHKLWAGTPAEHIANAVSAQEVSSILPATSTALYVDGHEKFARLKEDLTEATRFIHLQYFIWERDRLTAEVVGILKQKLAEGLEVRITYDYLGSISFNKSELNELKTAGADVRADVTDLARINYRNHRKIVVIDGEIGYTGGSNMGQEYIDGGERFATWRDTNVRITGQAVAELQKLFASRWYLDRDGEDLLIERYFPAPGGHVAHAGHLTQLVAHTHEGLWQASRRAHMIAIAKAEKTAFIQSPYFIPDAGMYDAMINAGLSGVDIRFMMAGVPDKRVPFWAAQTYFGRLLSAGVRVYLYEAGFTHAKTITVDSTVSAVGTMNLDIRSMHLHKELMLWMFDEGLTRELEDLFLDDITRCHEVTIADVRAVSRRERFRNQGCRLLSNLL